MIGVKDGTGPSVTTPPPAKRKRGIGMIALVVAVAVVALLVGWALGRIFSPPSATSAETTVNTFTVKQGSIGRSITLNASAVWGSEASGINRAAGVVTSMEPSDRPKSSGDPIYAVDLAPVALVAGRTPAFRDITAGTEGPDVVQLAAMLAARGYGVAPDTNKVDWAFGQAIKAWQRNIGAKETGTVAKGDVIFTPGLPARIQFDAKTMSVGATLAGGETVLTVASAVPEFSIEVPNEQAQTIPVGTPITIQGKDAGGKDAKWPGKVSGVRDAANGSNKLLILGSATKAPICDKDCGSLTAENGALFPTEITLVPHREGLVVPSSAIRTSSTGDTSVRLASGTEQPVKVVETASGMTVVTGLDEGTVIQLWAPAAPKP